MADMQTKISSQIDKQLNTQLNTQAHLAIFNELNTPDKVQACYQLLAELNEIRLKGTKDYQFAELNSVHIKDFINAFDSQDNEMSLLRYVGIRIFFSPIDAFLDNHNSEMYARGRIPRDLIPALWFLLMAELPEVRLRQFANDAEILLQKNQFAKVREKAEKLRQDCIEPLTNVYNDAKVSHYMGEALAKALDNDNALKIIGDILLLLSYESEIEILAQRLGICQAKKLTVNSDYDRVLSEVYNNQIKIFPIALAFTSTITEHVEDIAIYAWSKIEPDDSEKMLLSPWAMALDYPLVRMQNLTDQIVAAENRVNFAEIIIPLLKEFNHIERALAGHISFPRLDRSFRNIVRQKQTVSNTIMRLTKDADALIYRCLRQGAKMIQNENGQLVPEALDSAIETLRLIVIANRSRDSLTINADLARLIPKTYRSTETMCVAVVEVAHNTPPDNENYAKIQGQAQAAIAITRARIGDEMADILASRLNSEVRVASA